MMRDWLMHIFNPLHIYCRMRTIRLPKSLATFLAGKWETAYKRMVGEKWT